MSTSLNSREQINSGSTSLRDDRRGDSVVVRDSVFIRVKGDTVVRERWRTEYRDQWHERLRVDTCWRDSIKTLEQVRTEIIEREVVPAWAWGVWAGLAVLLIIIYSLFMIKR